MRPASIVFSSTSVVLATFELSLVSPIGQPARNRQIAYVGWQWAASRMRASFAVKRGCPRARSSQQRQWSPSAHRPLLGTLSSDLSSHTDERELPPACLCIGWNSHASDACDETALSQISHWTCRYGQLSRQPVGVVKRQDRPVLRVARNFVYSHLAI